MTKTIQNGGFTNPAGGLLTGNLLLVLSQDAKVAAAPNQVAPIATRIPISAGNIAPTLIYFNDELLPNNTYYTATAYDAAENKTYGPEIVSLTGAGPLDLGTLVPLLISPDPLFSNPVLQNPTLAQTITGSLSISGARNIDNVRYVDSANSAGWAGSDVGAWINSAYADCPVGNSPPLSGSGGCQIKVAPAGTGACYVATTPIVFSTNLKYVLLQGDPGGATCINYAQTTAFTAITYNTGSPNTTSVYYRQANGIRDLRVVGAGQGNPTTALILGGTNGCEGCVFNGLQLEQFGTGVQFANNAFNILFFASKLINNNTPVSYPAGLTGSGEDIQFNYSVISNCGTPGNGINIGNVGGPVDFYFIADDIDGCSINNNNTTAPPSGVHIYISGGHFEDPGSTGLAAYDFITQASSNGNSLSISGTQFTLDNPTNAHPELISLGSNGFASVSDIVVVKNGAGALQATHLLTSTGAWVNNKGMIPRNSPFSGSRFNISGSTNLLDCDSQSSATSVGCSFITANSFAFGVTVDSASIAHLSLNGDFATSTTLHQVQVTGNITTAGTPCTNGELLLSAGWQSTGTATVTAVAGQGQTCSWTITTGTTTAANPTVTDTLTNALPTATTVCEMNIHGGTHTPAAGEGFQQTTLSATAPVFTFNGTPTAGGTTYFVTRRCGP